MRSTLARQISPLSVQHITNQGQKINIVPKYQHMPYKDSACNDNNDDDADYNNNNSKLYRASRQYGCIVAVI